MTSFAFILGIMPLVFATGAGALGRRSVGTTIVGGMLLSTVLNLVFIPVLYVILSTILSKFQRKRVLREGWKRSPKSSRLRTVRDNEVLDAAVDFGADDAAIDQILLTAVGPEAHDASGPRFCHAGNGQQFLQAGAVDVDALFGRQRGLVRAWSLRYGAGRGDAECACQKRDPRD